MPGAFPVADSYKLLAQARNFVLADSKCNGAKRDRLPACEHLAK